VQDVLLALLAKEPSHGYELRARLQEALGPLHGALNAGQVYVTLTRLERSGLVGAEHVGQVDRPDRKVYALTAAGQQRVQTWLADVSWAKPTDVHLKLVAAAAAGLADPIDLVEAQRRELLRRLADVQRVALTEPDGSAAALLLDGVILRLEADLRWLDACARHWDRKGTR
jgi:DNA-binding PadR family transcriptional regulator